MYGLYDLYTAKWCHLHVHPLCCISRSMVVLHIGMTQKQNGGILDVIMLYIYVQVKVKPQSVIQASGSCPH